MEKWLKLIDIRRKQKISNALASDRSKRGKYQKMILPVPTKYDYQRKEVKRYLFGFRIVDTKIKEKDIAKMDISLLTPSEDWDIVIGGKHFNYPPRIVNPCKLKLSYTKADVLLQYCTVVYHYKLPNWYKIIPFNEPTNGR
jgi:hypothetical protein